MRSPTMKESGSVFLYSGHTEPLLPILDGTRLILVDTFNRAASDGSLSENPPGDLDTLLVALERIYAKVGCAQIGEAV